MDGLLGSEELGEQLGERIKRARLGRGLTLEELARRAGCTRGYLSQIENGKNAGVPSREMLIALEGAMSLPAGMLVGLGQWARLEPHVRERAGGRASGGVSLDALYQSGVLKRLVVGEGVGGEKRGRVGNPTPGPRSIQEGSCSSMGGRSVGTPPQPLPSGEGFMKRGWVSVPLMNVVQAGVVTEHADLGFPAGTSDECAAVPREMSGGDVDAFACRVVGVSMEPEYREGDVVVFSPNRTPTDGRDCFVRLEAGGVTFKRVWFVARGEGQGSAAADARRGGALQQSETPPLPLPSGEGFIAVKGFVSVEVGAHTHMVLEARNAKFGWRVVEREEVGGLAVAVSVVRGV